MLLLWLVDTAQALACLAVIVVSGTLHEKCEPYISAEIGQLERFALLTRYISHELVA
jgi:hypothetical protein